jgi:hypothetical protein
MPVSVTVTRGNLTLQVPAHARWRQDAHPKMISCRACGDASHTAAECPVRQCHHCHCFGHEASECEDAAVPVSEQNHLRWPSVRAL